MDHYENGSPVLVIEYKVYDSKTKKKLNLELCRDVKIRINIPELINEEESFKYNASSEYYKDVCFTYTTNDRTDITLEDRKKEFIDNNMSLCKPNCDYIGYDYDIKKASCDCEVKIKFSTISEIVFDKNLLKNKFLNINNFMNYKVMYCYPLLFTVNGIKYNIGSYIMLVIIFLCIILLCYFWIKGHKT